MNFQLCLLALIIKVAFRFGLGFLYHDSLIMLLHWRNSTAKEVTTLHPTHQLKCGNWSSQTLQSQFKKQNRLV